MQCFWYTSHAPFLSLSPHAEGKHEATEALDAFARDERHRKHLHMYRSGII